jgi:hypothetical protein
LRAVFFFVVGIKKGVVKLREKKLYIKGKIGAGGGGVKQDFFVEVVFQDQRADNKFFAKNLVIGSKYARVEGGAIRSASDKRGP